MKNISLVAFIAFLLILIGFFINQTYSSNHSQNVPGSVTIKLDRNTYNQNEPISFTITNGTSNNIFYFPETCASRLVQVMKSLSNELTPIYGEHKVCQLAPSVQALLPNKSESDKVPEKDLLKMNPGTYKLRFSYSPEMRDRFSLGALLSIDSESFIID